MNTLTKHDYICHKCGESYMTKNAADRCKLLPKEELKFAVGDQVFVDAGRDTQQTGTVVGIRFIAGFSGGKHFAVYTIELDNGSLLQRNARSLKLHIPTTHPNKQEILDGIAAGRAWEFRPTRRTSWISPASCQKFPTWVTGYEYRLKPVPDPHPNRAEVEAGIAAGRTWEWKFKEETESCWAKTTQRIPSWLDNCDYRLTPEPEYVPIGPEDVPPGSVLRWGFGQPGWSNFDYVSSTGVWLPVSSESEFWSFERLREKCEINRSLPLTGKWDANAWEPCKKIKQ